MKRFLLYISISFLLSVPSFANHITGGQIYYTYLGRSGTDYQYKVTLLLYRDHFSTGAPLDPAASIAVFDKATSTMISNNSVTLLFIEYLQLTSPSPCITNPPVVYYDVGHYEFTISVPASSSGYIIAYQRCCRIAGINNLSAS